LFLIKNFSNLKLFNYISSTEQINVKTIVELIDEFMLDCFHILIIIVLRNKNINCARFIFPHTLLKLLFQIENKQPFQNDLTWSVSSTLLEEIFLNPIC